MVSDKWLQENRGWYRVPIKDPTIQFLESDDWNVDVGWALGWTRKKTGTYSPFTDPGASAARFCFTYKPVENWRYMVIEAPNFSTPLGVSSKGASVMAQGGRPSATAGIWTVAWVSGPTTYAKWDAEIKALVIDPGYYVNKDWIVNMKYWSSARSGPVFSVSTVKLYKVGPPGGEGVPLPVFDESEYENPEWGNRNPRAPGSAGPKYDDYGPNHSGSPVNGRNPPLEESRASDGSPESPTVPVESVPKVPGVDERSVDDESKDRTGDTKDVGADLFNKDTTTDDKNPLSDNPRVSEKATKPNSEVECVVEGYFDCRVGDHMIIPEDPLRRRFIVTEVEYDFSAGALRTYIHGSVDGDIRSNTVTILTGVVNYLFGRR